MNESISNPDNLLGLNEHIENSFEAPLELKLFFGDILRINLYNAAIINSEESEKTYFTNNIRELYLTVTPVDWFFIDAGRKVVQKGIGFFKNPVDFIKNKGDMDLSKSKDDQVKFLIGPEVISFEVFIDKFNFNYIYSPMQFV